MRILVLTARRCKYGRGRLNLILADCLKHRAHAHGMLNMLFWKLIDVVGSFN